MSNHWIPRSAHKYWLGYGSQSFAKGNKLQFIDAQGGYTSLFTHPHVQCHFCDAKVYFCTSQRRARTYFDELGPPWPEHECVHREKDSHRYAALQYRPDEEPNKSRYPRLLSAFKTRYGLSPWGAYCVESCEGHTSGYLVVSRHTLEKTRKMFITPVAFKKDALVFILKGELSYFDKKKGQPSVLSITKYLPIIRATNRKKLASKIKKANRKRHKKMSRKIFRKGRESKPI